MKKPKEKVDNLAVASFWLGLISLVLIPIYLAIAYLFEEFGRMMPTLPSVVFPLAIIGIVLGLVCRKKKEVSNRSYKFTRAGIIMSAITLGLIILLFLFIMIAFLPELFQS